MRKCIDVFYTPHNRNHTYISFVIDENGAVVTSRTHEHIATVIDWCQRQRLPARSTSALVREELASHGIEVLNQVPGGDPADVQPDSVTVIIPREQAHLLRQLLTTMREWGEGGRATIRYLMAAYAEWLSAFDRELARALSSDGKSGGRSGVVSTSYIDIFSNPEDHHTPYQAWVWRSGRVIERASHLHLDQTATYCKQIGLPVIVSNPELRARLRTYGVDAREPTERELGALE